MILFLNLNKFQVTLQKGNYYLQAQRIFTQVQIYPSKWSMANDSCKDIYIMIAESKKSI